MISIRKIKKEIEYLNNFLIIEALQYHKDLTEMKNLKMIVEEEILNAVDIENENFLNYLSQQDEIFPFSFNMMN